MVAAPETAPAPGRSAHQWIVAALLPVLPPVAVVAAHAAHPVGGASSALVRTAVLGAVIGGAEVIVLLHPRRPLPAPVPWLILLAAVAAAVPLQLLVPSLPD